MNEDQIIVKLIEHDERFNRLEEKMATKDDLRQVYNTLDAAMVILKRLDQERVFTAQWVSRIEQRVEEDHKEILRLKQVLNVA